MLLICGIGNPTQTYLHTRHNAGFLGIDAIANKFGCELKTYAKFTAKIAKTELFTKTIFLMQPETFMNNSGISVSSFLNYYKIAVQNLIVIHDDMDLPLGGYKIKFAGGSAGHNGIKSIDQSVGNQYTRIRIGIGRPESREEVLRYVLSKFSASELQILNEVLAKIVLDLPSIIARLLNSYSK